VRLPLMAEFNGPNIAAISIISSSASFIILLLHTLLAPVIYHLQASLKFHPLKFNLDFRLRLSVASSCRLAAATDTLPESLLLSTLTCGTVVPAVLRGG
jgi:hypothetical protein